MQVLCALSDLPEDGAARLAFPGDTHGHGLCVVRRQGRLHAYLNRCPHRQAPMDWLPGRFLDASGKFIQCALHGARFEIKNGRCVAGPCLGQHLQAVRLLIDGGQVLLDETVLPPDAAQDGRAGRPSR